jgi:hypothetical protein
LPYQLFIEKVRFQAAKVGVREENEKRKYLTPNPSPPVERGRG